MCDSLGGLYWGKGRFCAFQANSTPFTVLDQCFRKDDCVTTQIPWDYCAKHGSSFGQGDRFCFLNYTATMLDQCYHSIGSSCNYVKPWNICSEPYFPGEPTLDQRACIVNGTIEVLDQCEGTYLAGTCQTTSPWELCQKLNTVSFENDRFCAFRVLPTRNNFDYKVALIVVSVICGVLFFGFMVLLFVVFSKSAKKEYTIVQ